MGLLVVNCDGALIEIWKVGLLKLQNKCLTDNNNNILFSLEMMSGNSQCHETNNTTQKVGLITIQIQSTKIF